MRCANGHKLADDGTCQESSDSTTKLIVGGQIARTGRLAKLVCSTTCCILDKLKRQAPDANGLKEHEINYEEQRPQGQCAPVCLTQLSFAQINRPTRSKCEHSTNTPTTRIKCTSWSIKQLENKRRANSCNNNAIKSPLTHTLSAPSSNVAHHYGGDNIRVNDDNQHNYMRQYTTGAVRSVATDMAAAVEAIASCNRHPARVLKFNQRQEPNGEDGRVKVSIPSSVDRANYASARRHAAAKPPFKKGKSGKSDKSPPVAFGKSSKMNEPDVDGGYAWIVLAVIFFINASTFGTARAYGLIFDKLARDDNKSRTEAAMPFTIMGAVENMAGPLTGYLLARTNNSWRATVFSGSCLITLSHLLAALLVDSHLGQLLSIGLMCGLGLSLVSISFFQLNNAYFVRYRSTAFGLGMTGAAFGTLYISPLCQYSLDNYGVSMCYLMLSLILLPNVPLSLLLKPKDEQITGAGAGAATG